MSLEIFNARFGGTHVRPPPPLHPLHAAARAPNRTQGRHFNFLLRDLKKNFIFQCHRPIEKLEKIAFRRNVVI